MGVFQKLFLSHLKAHLLGQIISNFVFLENINNYAELFAPNQFIKLFY